MRLRRGFRDLIFHIQFCLATGFAWIDKEEAEEQNDSEIAEGSMLIDIIEHHIDKQGYAEHVHSDHAPFRQRILALFRELCLHLTKLKESQGKGNHRYCEEFHECEQIELSLISPIKPFEGQNIEFAQYHHQRNHTYGAPEINHQYFLYAFHNYQLSIINYHFVIGVRLRIERPNVTSSVYSNSSPTLIPRAMTLIFTPV